MDDSTLHFIDYHSAIVPVYYCLGARLRVLDLDPSQGGQTVALLLQRDGDCALLPIADTIMRSDGQRWQRGHAAETISHATTALERDGWELTGKLTITFEGVDCDHTVSA